MEKSTSSPEKSGTAPALADQLRRRRFPILVHILCDSFIWIVAIPFTIIARLDFSLDSLRETEWVKVVGSAIVFQILAGALTGVYRRRWRVGTFDEMVAISTSVGSATIAVLIALEQTAWAPRSVPILAAPIVLLASLTARSFWRVLRQRMSTPQHAEPLVVVGAGEAGYRLVRSLLEDPSSAYRPVATVDDDHAKRSLRWRNVRVEGTVDDLSSVCARHGATTVLLAVPSSSDELYRRVDRLCRQASLRLLVLPRLDDVLSPTAADIRPLQTADLLGRPSRAIDLNVAGAYVTGRRVLVTGAGGSIGSELCRQLTLLSPERLGMLDRDESGLHATQLSIEGRALLDSQDLLLADIRDQERLNEVFAEFQPHVVFHAAALKHLTLLENAPAEGWKTNVVGTLSVLRAAAKFGCERFVNISTDKAADPSCVLGLTKRIAELATAGYHSNDGMACVSVRFGNVLGSRGSMLTTFDSQARNGGPLTVTDPEVSRYFMTIEEAVRLTITAGGNIEDRSITVLDMGEPIKILDVARTIAGRHEPEPEIVFTGLRPGEKLNEVLVGGEEVGSASDDGLFIRVAVPHIDVDGVDTLPVPTTPSDIDARLSSLLERSTLLRRPDDVEELRQR